MKTELIMKHWQRGGTGITNFRPSSRWIYEQAIAEYVNSGGKSELVICTSPIGDTNIPTDFSLHSLDSSDLSGFWEIFKEIKG